MLGTFREVVVVDIELPPSPASGQRRFVSSPTSCAAGAASACSQDQFGPSPPYATGPDVLFVAFYATAELGVYRVLGWPMPERVLDLFVEFREPHQRSTDAGGFEPTRRLSLFRAGRHGRGRETRNAGSHRQWDVARALHT